MMPSSDVKHELCEILWRIGDGSPASGDIERLEELIGDDAALQNMAARFAAMCGMLHWDRGCRETCKRPQDAAAMPAPCIPPVSPLIEDTFAGAVSHSASSWFASGWPVAYLVATVIFAIGLTIAARVYVSQPMPMVQNPALPSPSGRVAGDEGGENAAPSTRSSVVGRITGMVDCQWEASGFSGQDSGESGQRSAISGQQLQSTGHYPPVTNHSVSLGDTFALHSGLLEITYDTGARVILQGPVTYEVESSVGGYLSIGKLTARLDKKVASGQWSVASESKIPGPSLTIIHQPLATNHDPLFTIKTPTAIITDLGTEFGVEVSREGRTSSHVFRGTIEVRTTSGNGKTGNSKILHANESAQVDGHGENCRITLAPTVAISDFVRGIPKQTIKTFDLVDVVAGGDGFSGRRNKGINPLTGRVVDALDTQAKKPWSADGQYHRVPQRPLVDGVFVPNGGNGPVQISSAGHIFEGFLKTSHETWQYLWAGGPLASDHVPTLLGGVDYAAPGHGLLYFNGNSAITFDLQAIRRANPGSTLLRFRAVAGNVSPMGIADIRVLVDGRQWFQRWQINGQSGAFIVVVPIADHDRFLTLATTDGGDGIRGDWLIFGDPCLELTTVETSTRAPAAQAAIKH
jgi:hypothetical protein